MKLILPLVLIFAGCANPAIDPGAGSFGTRAGTTALHLTGDIAGFAAKNIQDVKIIPYSFAGWTGCLLEIDNRPILSSAGLPLIK